jgi:hypothetical protein
MMNYSGSFGVSPLGVTPPNPYYQPPSTTNPQYPSIPNPIDNLIDGIGMGLIGALSIYAWPVILVGVFALILIALVVGLGGFTFGMVLGDDS